MKTVKAMNKLLIKSAKLVSTPGANSPIVSANLIKLPHDRGYIFSLVKILGKPDAKRQKVDTIIKDHLIRLEQTTTEGANIPRRFEQILGAINEDINSHIKESSRIPLSDFNAIVGIVHKNQVFISGIGNLGAIFMHQTATSRYVIYELDKQFTNDEKSWDKPFITILDGELHPGDIFYVATRAKAREINITELQDILVTLPPSGALKRIQQHVSVGSSYAGIDFVVQDRKHSGPPKKVNPMSSIEHLGNTKEKTANLLGEQSPDIGNIIDKITKPALNALSKPGTRGTKSTLRRLLFIIAKYSIGALSFVSSLIKNLGSLLFGRLRGSKGKSGSSANEQHDKKSPSVLVKIINLPTSTKLISVGVLAISIALISSVSLLNTKTTEQDQQTAFTTIIDRAEEKKNAADASLIYEDKSQARALLAEAGALLETLNATTDPEQFQIDNLKDEINNIFFKLRGVTTPNITTIAEAGTTFVTAVEAGGVIYGVNANQELFKLNELELSFQKVETINGSIGQTQISTGEGSNFLFLDSNGRLGRADTTNNTMNPLTSGIEALTDVRAITLYNENLYALNVATEQIVKMRPQGIGYEAGTPWITSKEASLKTAQDIAIDGDVYLLTSSKIIKFTSGKEVGFNLDIVDPILNSATQFWTTIGTESIYILDAAEKRVLIFNKEGKFLAQYVDDEFGNALRLIIREDQRNLIIVTPTKALSFPAVHTLN